MSPNPTQDPTADSQTESIEVRIVNNLGLHLRPASQLVKVASQFEDCQIAILKDGQRINAKSIMGVIMLAAEQGSELIIEATGVSAVRALEHMEELISNGFGEEM